MDRSRRELIDACIYIDEKEHTYRVQLDRNKILIGNTQECDVLIKSTTSGTLLGEFIATRRGFELRSRGDQPITINSHAISGNQRLHHGDVLVLGSARVRYFEVPEVSEVTLQFGIAGLHSGHAFFLTNQSFVRIGQTVGELRIPDNTLDDPQVAIENLGPGATFIRQLGSETETTVDGVKLTERIAIKDGSTIQMGETHIVIREIINIPLPAPSEILLTSNSPSKQSPDDEKRTSPEAVKTVRKAHIRTGGDVRKTHSESAPAIHAQETIDLDRAVPPETLEALRKSRTEGLQRSRQPRGASSPTPQPYTIRSDELREAQRQKTPSNTAQPYYVPRNEPKRVKEQSPATSKPYYLKDGGEEEAAPPGANLSPAENHSSKPYYMPEPGSESPVGERNSPLDWMEGRPPEPDEQTGVTVLLSRDSVDNALSGKGKYYVPKEQSASRAKPKKIPNEQQPDRAGVTLQDTSLDDLD